MAQRKKNSPKTHKTAQKQLNHNLMNKEKMFSWSQKKDPTLKGIKAA
jgi:hypothetical protein